MPVEAKVHNQHKIEHVEMCNIVKRFRGFWPTPMSALMLKL